MSHDITHGRLQASTPARTFVAALLTLVSLLACACRTESSEPILLPRNVTLVSHAEPIVLPQKIAATAPAEQLDLASCLDLAFQHQPRIAVQRASLGASEDGLRALEKLLAPPLLAPELPIRRRQAELGVTAASAALDQVQRETAYAVTRTYFSVLYARDQERTTRSVVDRLTATRDAAKKALDGGARDVTAVDVNRATVYLRLAETRRIESSQGVKRALVALKEAIGLGCDAHIEVAPGGLSEPKARPSLDEVVAAAVQGRPELIRASVFADVVCLEAEAQGTSHHRQMETFAAGSDIHATQVPQEEHNGEYRPGAVPPEMPTLLAGSRKERVSRAHSFHARALAAVDVTRNLVVLDAESAYLRWEQASLQAKEAREAAETAESNARDLNKDYTAGAKVKVDDVVNAWVLASQARAQYNEALYRQILALADLERITAGAFCAKLTELVAPGAPGKEKGNGKK
jgi:outer membrane protein TolC